MALSLGSKRLSATPTNNSEESHLKRDVFETTKDAATVQVVLHV
jgi:hypothetical protein